MHKSTPYNAQRKAIFPGEKLSPIKPAEKRGNRSLPENLGKQAAKSPRVKTSKSLREETLLERFDKAMEKEIQRLKDTPPPNVLDPAAGLSSHASVYKAALQPQVVRSSTSGLDISANLRGEQDTDLLEAALRLAKAEEICRFEGAVRAAEQAAAAVPPELAEEAAAATARDFKTEVTGFVKETIPDRYRPVEVVGYVGITSPKKQRQAS